MKQPNFHPLHYSTTKLCTTAQQLYTSSCAVDVLFNRNSFLGTTIND